MGLHQIAGVLEIIGFSLATIFAGILWNREVVGEWADNMNLKFINLSTKLIKQYKSLLKFAQSPIMIERLLSGCITRSISMAFIIIGLLFSIKWLFWLGTAFVILDFILGTTVVFIWQSRRFGWRSLWAYPLFLCWNIMAVYFIAPIVLFVFYFFVILHGFFTLLLAWVAGRDIIKKGTIIVGSLMVIVGLILETVATW